MIKRLALFLLLACCAGFAQTTAFTANLKDLVGNIPGTYVELSLKNCAGSGATPTIPHVNGVGVISFPVQLYPNPSTGLVSGNPYDETGIVCGSSTGVSYYHIAIYQGDATRSLVKKLLFADDFDVQGASFNLNSATPRSGSVISPPVATAVLTNPAGNQTIVQPAGTALSINHLSAGFAQSANNTKMIPATRFTDTSPLGDFLDFTNAAGGTHLWEVDVTGSLLNGIIPAARVSSGTVAIANGGTGQTTAAAAFNALSPTTTLGDIIYANGAGTNTRLAGNTVATKQYLSQTGTGTVSAAPAWAQVNFTDLAGTGTCAQEPALTGDTTSSAGSCATTTAKVNGVSYPAAPSTHAVPVTTAANTETYKVVPDCTDTTGNHINYTQSTDAFSCGTSVPASTVTLTGAQAPTNKTFTGAANGNNVTLLNEQDVGSPITGNGTDQTIYTFTIPANTLAAGKCIMVKAGATNGNAVATTYKVIFGATTVGSFVSNAATDNVWGTVDICNNAASQTAQHARSLGFSAATAVGNLFTTPAETMTNAIVVKLTGNVAAANTFTGKFWSVTLDQ